MELLPVMAGIIVWRVYVHARRWGGSERQAVAWSIISVVLFPVGLIAFILYGERHLSGGTSAAESSQSG